MKKTPALFVFLLFVLGGPVCVSGQPSNVQQDGALLLLASSNDWGDDDWDNTGEEEDAFGNIMHTYFPVFDKVTGEFIDTPQGMALKFTLSVSFPKDQDPDEKNNVEEAWVYFVEENSGPWTHVPLKRDGSTKFTEIWTAEVSLKEFGLTPDSRIVYLFRVKDHFGSVVTELPETDPGWPPNPNDFFPGAVDNNNSEDVVPANLDILNTFVARDRDYIYLASRYEGDVSPGYIDPPSAYGYFSKFTNPAVHEHEGLMVGFMQTFIPLISYPYNLLDFNAISFLSEWDYLMSFRSRFDDNGREYIIGIAGDTLYSRTNLNAVCASGCDSLRIIFITVANNSNEAFMPIPYNCTPFTIVYLRSHSLNMNGETPVVSGDSMDVALPAPVILFPDNVGAVMNDDEILRRKKEFEKFTGGEIIRQGPGNYRTYFEYKVYEGPDPIRANPGDIIIYNDYRFEVYTRNNRVKVRIFHNDEWWHTIMIGPDTKPPRDEQHNDGYIYITLSNFSEDPLSCDFSIRDSEKK